MKGTITITGGPTDAAEAAREVDVRNKIVMFKNCPPFTDCISEINNTQVHNAKDLDVAIVMHNLIEYNENYSKISESL